MRQEINSKPQARTHYQIALIAGIIVLCVASNILLGFFFRAFTFWKSLPTPPSGAKYIIDADPYGLWVETFNNQIFTLSVQCYREEDCHRYQWILVNNVSDIAPISYGPISREDNCITFPYGYSPGNPKGEIVECVKAAYPGIEFGTGFDAYFALMADGSVKYREYKGYYFGALCITPSIVLLLVTVSIYLSKMVGRKKQKAA